MLARPLKYSPKKQQTKKNKQTVYIHIIKKYNDSVSKNIIIVMYNISYSIYSSVTAVCMQFVHTYLMPKYY